MSKKKIRLLSNSMSLAEQAPGISLLAHGKNVHRHFNEIIYSMEYG